MNKRWPMFIFFTAATTGFLANGDRSLAALVTGIVAIWQAVHIEDDLDVG